MLTRKYTEEELISELKRYFIEFEETPTSCKINKTIGYPKSHNFVTVFGKWSIALERSGFEARYTKWDVETVSQLFKSNNCELLSTIYKNPETPLDFKCRCGNFAKKSLSEFKIYPFCANCGLEVSAQKRRYTYEQVKEIFKNENCELISDEYKNSTQKVHYKCSCGNISEIRLSSFLQGRRCSICVNNRRKSGLLSYDHVKNFFSENNCVLLSNEYLGNAKKLKYICECGETAFTTFASFKNGVRCKKCGIERQKKTSQIPLEQISKVFEENGCALLDGDYSIGASRSVLNYICSCGNVATINYYAFINGSRCNECKSAKLSKLRAGRKFPQLQGENNPRWDHNKPIDERERTRLIPEYKPWRTSVYERDNFTCQCCGDKKGGNLAAHHLNGWDWFHEGRFDLGNGITLCDLCHSDFHGLYGYGNNTKEQWDEYMSNLYCLDPAYELI